MPIGNVSFTANTLAPMPERLNVIQKKLTSVNNLCQGEYKIYSVKNKRGDKKIALENHLCHVEDSLLIKAIKQNDVELMEIFFSRGYRYFGAEQLNTRDRSGNTPVMLAVKNNNIIMLKRLEENFSSERLRYKIPLDFSLPDNDGNSPLMVAIQNRQNEMINYLLSRSATHVYQKNKNGESAFTIAIADNALPLDIFKQVCDHSQLAAFDESGRTLLMKTVMSASAEKVKYALKGVDHMINLMDANGDSALSLAKRRGDEYIIKLVHNSIDNLKRSSMAKISMDDYGVTDFHKNFIADRGDFIFGLSDSRNKYLSKLVNASKDNFNIINYYTNRIARRIFLSEKNLALLHEFFFNRASKKCSHQDIIRNLDIATNIYEAASGNDDKEYPYAWREYFLIRDEIKKFDIKTILAEVLNSYNKYDHFHHLAYSVQLGYRIPLFWKRSSKVGIEIVLRESKRHLHFILDGLEQKRIIEKTEDSVTSSELRYIYRNREKLAGRLHFYDNYRQVPAPWTVGETFSELWAGYIPGR